jgi:ATP adenylyltransferase
VNAPGPRPGSLWAAARSRAEAARERGALEPIATTSSVVEESGARFIVRVVDSLARKDALGAQRASARGGARRADPFLPHDEALHVAEVSATHRCLLNKFPVLDDHLLVVTRGLADQEELLDRADFEALWACLPEVDEKGEGGSGLGFYNGGEVAGASQRHKHLQVVLLPLDPRVPGVPIEPLLALDLAGETLGGGLAAARGLPFAHSLARLDGASAADALDLYRRMLARHGIARDGDARQRAPYNLLVTRAWMLVAPRSAERFEGVSVNALGFAGALLVRTRAQLAVVTRAGVLDVLRAVGVPA